MNQSGDTKRIEWTEEKPVKIDGNEYAKGDIDRVSDEEHQLYVFDLAWGKDADSGETGTRTAGAVKLQPHKITQPAKVA